KKPYMDSTSPPLWSNLPADLLEKIAVCLQNSCRPDVLRLRSVCRSWRSSIPAPPVVPNSLLKLPTPPYIDFYLKECIVYSIQPISNPHATPWLVRLEFSESGTEILPVVGKKNVGTEFSRPMSLDLQHFRVDVIIIDSGMSVDGVRVLMTWRLGDDKLAGIIPDFHGITKRHGRFSKKLDEQKRKWVEIGDELKDCVLFLTPPFSFSISARSFPGYKANCIYTNKYSFINNQRIQPLCHHPGSGVVIYDMENGDANELCQRNGCSLRFWPPPPWLCKETTSFSFKSCMGWISS
ncbi:hypothetical protein Tsubulata_041824, partial [Turnera subulata]